MPQAWEDMDEKAHHSALKVKEGIEQPASVDDRAAERFKGRAPHLLDSEGYVRGITAGDRTILSRAITLVESTLARHQTVAQGIIAGCMPYAGQSVRVGITGVPGVGKSTFLEALGKHLTLRGNRIAVLAIDPSSRRSKGSILGDKTRMEDLANDPSAFIRPSASAGTLGGVARKTRETIILCEAAGYNVIFVETVGVGQSETAVHSMVDFFLLMMLAGAGDELQGIKRGIMEMADGIVINKADGDNIRKAELARQEFENALHLFPAAGSGWIPKVLTSSAAQGTGVPEAWEMISDFITLSRANGHFEKRRQEQSVEAFTTSIEDALRLEFFQHKKIQSAFEALKQEILQGKTSPYLAAGKLMELFRKKN